MDHGAARAHGFRQLDLCHVPLRHGPLDLGGQKFLLRQELDLESLEMLQVQDNPSLTTLEGAETLAAVTDTLRIAENPSLTSLDGLENMHTVGTIMILDNDALASLVPLHAWASDTVTWSMLIESNASLPQCEVQAFDAEQTDPRATCEVKGMSYCTGNTGTGDCDGDAGSGGGGMGGEGGGGGQGGMGGEGAASGSGGAGGLAGEGGTAGG